MLQTGEIIIIALLALVVLGPKRLPEMARKVGGWLAELRRAAREITAGLEAEVSDIREIGRDLRGPLDEVTKPLNEIRDDVKGFGKEAGEALEWKGPKPLSGPTPEDAMRDYAELNRLDEASGASAGEDGPLDSDTSSGGDGEADASEPEEPSG